MRESEESAIGFIMEYIKKEIDDGSDYVCYLIGVKHEYDVQYETRREQVGENYLNAPVYEETKVKIGCKKFKLSLEHILRLFRHAVEKKEDIARKIYEKYLNIKQINMIDEKGMSLIRKWDNENKRKEEELLLKNTCNLIDRALNCGDFEKIDDMLGRVKKEPQYNNIKKEIEEHAKKYCNDEIRQRKAAELKVEKEKCLLLDELKRLLDELKSLKEIYEIRSKKFFDWFSGDTPTHKKAECAAMIPEINRLMNSLDNGNRKPVGDKPWKCDEAKVALKDKKTLYGHAKSLKDLQDKVGKFLQPSQSSAAVAARVR